MVEEEGGGWGIMVFYDDPRTKLEVDYLELYDIDGNLLLVSWIDRFGVCQVAIDRALLNKDQPTVDGVLVLITGGTEPLKSVIELACNEGIMLEEAEGIGWRPRKPAIKKFHLLNRHLPSKSGGGL